MISNILNAVLVAYLIGWLLSKFVRIRIEDDQWHFDMALNHLYIEYRKTGKVDRTKFVDALREMTVGFRPPNVENDLTYAQHGLVAFMTEYGIIEHEHLSN